jgi:hypothetical protein
MEKTAVLIERLLEQYHNNASNKQLRITTQLLLSELEKESETEEELSHQVVSVFFPTASRFNNFVDEAHEETMVLTETKKEEKIIPPPEIKPAPVTQEEKEDFRFDPMTDIPTLALKQQEVNETIATQSESLNDKLRATSSQKEIGSTIKPGPIKDLRKAIGINDQYLFINELFRGDQTMYERSIKTINGFNIYGEAEFWIKRELKLKLGWAEGSEVVQLFDQLVKRRFS